MFLGISALLLFAGFLRGCSSPIEPSTGTEGTFLEDIPPQFQIATAEYAGTIDRSNRTTFGLLVLSKAREGEVVIHRVELLDTSGDLTHPGDLVAGRGRGAFTFSPATGFPPHEPGLGPLAPLEGAVVPPGKLGLEVLVGLRVGTAEFSAFTGLRVRYSVDGTDYFQDFPLGYAYCPSLSSDECSDRYYEVSSDWK